MIQKVENQVYWKIVKECLEEIFGLRQSDAHLRSKKLRDEIEQSKPKSQRALFYHAEPIDVASDLACTGKKLKSADWQKYDEILARNSW